MDGSAAETETVSPLEIGAIYEAALDGRLEPALLDLVAATMPQAAILLYRQARTGVLGTDVLHRGLGALALPPFPQRLALDAPLFREHWHQPVGAVFRVADLMPSDAFRTSAINRDWLANAGLFDGGVGVVILRKGLTQTVLELRYPGHQAARRDRGALALLHQIAPHLARAARIADLAKGADQAQTQARSFLELSSFPTFIVGHDCRIQVLNSRAEGLLRRNTGLYPGMDGALHALDCDDDTHLQQAVAETGLAPSAHGIVMGLKAARRCEPRVLTLTALSSKARGPLPFGLGHGQPGQVAIMVIDGVDRLKIGRDALWGLFGLTEREAELALALLEGRTLPEYARANGMSKQTLRNQLSSILRKTGTSRQSELVALLLQMARALPP